MHALQLAGTTNEGQLYTEIPELGDEKLSSTEIPLSQVRIMQARLMGE